MIPFKVSEIALFLNPKKAIVAEDIELQYVSIDSRKLNEPHRTIFVALPGSMQDGHNFIDECIDRGVKTFLVSKTTFLNSHPGISFIVVENTLEALHQIAVYNRSKCTIPVIGITGSNGKTTVKEWLSFLLSKKSKVVKSPGSYNSQIGVPLSILQLELGHEIGVFEAGISKRNEMEKLELMIQPTLGIFTNIGEAHSEGFNDLQDKIIEKLKLFKNTNQIIVCADDPILIKTIRNQRKAAELITWGTSQDANLFKVVHTSTYRLHSHIELLYNDQTFDFDLNFSDRGSIQNVLHCVAALITLGYSMEACQEMIQEIFPLPMRLNISKGRDDSTIINDAYNHDLTSLRNALEFLFQQKGHQPTIAILSDIEESQMDFTKRIQKIASLLQQYPVDQIWWVGDHVPFFAHKSFSKIDELEAFALNKNIANHYILIKGARKHHLEKIKHHLEYKSHSSKLEIDLSALDHNLQFYARKLESKTGIMAVIKAGAYGTSSEQLARLLQYRGVQYLAVAFADEGIELRESGIDIPILVLNPDRHSFHQLFKYHLEPEIYCLSQLEDFIHILHQKQQPLPIHLKLDSGMNRLGFKANELEKALRLIHKNKIHVNTVFSHLAGSEEPDEDHFSNEQYQQFIQLTQMVKTGLGYRPKMHFVNTSGIVRFPEYHHDLVRLGLGLYGIDMTKSIGQHLEKVHTFTATIIQIKWAEKGEKIGYNQKGVATEKMKIGIINAGYADGIPRALGCGKFSVLIGGEKAPIVGNVCMDLTIIDLSKCNNVQEGDEVEIFGKNNPIEKMAKTAETIPYEILARISNRVKKEWVYW